MNAPTHLIGDERGAYTRGADRARLAYTRKHGAGVMTLAERQAWHATHDEPMALAADRGGMSAVRKMHNTRVKHLETITAPGRVAPVAPAFLATVTRDAEHAAARLEILAPVKARKSPARKLAAVPDVVAAPVKLRKTSKLATCERHAAGYAAMPRADRMRRAVEGGMSSQCESGACILTPGVDIFAPDLVAAGAVRVDELNNTRKPVETPAPAAVDNDAAAVESRRVMFANLGWSTTPAPDVAAPVETPETVAAPVAPEVVLHDVDRAPIPFVDCDECGTRDYVGESHTCEPREVAAPVAPETVPAPMPAMSRAARKASRRELAATMRAAGIKPDGLAWQLARAGVDLADIPAILSGDVAMPETVVSA